MIIEVDAYLEHVGVKGMKWGVRKNANKKQRSPEVQRRIRNGRIQTGIMLAAIGGLTLGMAGLGSAEIRSRARGTFN